MMRELVAAKAGDERVAGDFPQAARRPRTGARRPTEWPKTSLISLKRSRSMHNAAKLPRHRAGAIDGLGKVGVEARAVGKVGQRIVVREMLDPGFGLELFGDVLRHDEQVLRLPVDASNSQPSAVGDAHAVARRLDLMLFQHAAVSCRKLIAIACDHSLRGRRRKDLMRGLADDLFARKTEILLRSPVDEHIAKVGNILHRDRHRHVFDDGS